MQKMILNKGIKLGLLQMLIHLSQYLLSNDLLNPPWEFTLINIAIIIGFIFYAIKLAYDLKENRNMKTALKIGVGISVVASVAMGIYNTIFTMFLEPGYTDLVIEKTAEEFAQQGLSDEKIENSIAIIKKMMTPWIMIPVGLISSSFWGVIIGFVTGAILKKRNKR